MRTPRLPRPLLLFLLIAGLGAPEGYSAPSSGPLRFRITLAKELAPAEAVGRLFVFMSGDPQPRERLGAGFVPGDTWLSAMEVEHLAPGEPFTFDPDLKAYPRPFSTAPAGSYQFMALLDANHSYAYDGQGEGDLYGPVTRIGNLNPADAAPISLTLTRRTEARVHPADRGNVRLVEFRSPLLTAFWGRSITMRAGVVLPPGYEVRAKGGRPLGTARAEGVGRSPTSWAPALGVEGRGASGRVGAWASRGVGDGVRAGKPVERQGPRGSGAQQQFPTVYHVHGFGGDLSEAWEAGPRLAREIGAGRRAAFVHVFLDGSFPTGHHEFADSVNNGPWGRVLTQEFIPYLEQRFRLTPRASARFLTGHSSGGWSTLWLQ